MKRVLWVVESYDDILGWQPSMESSFNRHYGLFKLSRWRKKWNGSGDKFRLVKYVPERRQRT